MPTPSQFGQRLRQLREQRQLTQTELAERSRVPSMMISHFETGVRQSGSMATFVKLAEALSCSVDYLVGRIDEDAPVGGQVGALMRAASTATADELDTLVKIARSLTAQEEQQTRRQRTGPPPPASAQEPES